MERKTSLPYPEEPISGSQPEPDGSDQHPSLKIILIYSFNLHLGFPTVSFLSNLGSKFLICLLP
jgi:hypothetical protein